MTSSYDRRTAAEKTAFASIGTSDDLTASDARDEARSLLGELRRYIKRCAPLIPLYKRLGVALETPQILTEGEAIRERANDIATAMDVLDKNAGLFSKFEKEFTNFCRQKANGTWQGTRGNIESVQDLPTANLLFKAGQELAKVLTKITKEDERGDINWTLDGYVGSEAKVYAIIEAAPGDLDSDANLSNPFFGAIKYYSDSAVIQETIDEFK